MIDTADCSVWPPNQPQRDGYINTHTYVFIGTLTATRFAQVHEDAALLLTFTLPFQPISEPKNLLLQCDVFWRS